MSKLRAVLDANVLYDSFLRDLLLSLFSVGLYEAKWTEKIIEEWVGHLLENRVDISPAANARTVRLMNEIKPGALVWAYEQYIDHVDLPDKDDRHVVAAALACGAQKIVTWNLGDFPNKLLKAFGIVADSPDQFLADLITHYPEETVDVFRGVRLRLRKPPMTVEKFFEGLQTRNMSLTAKCLDRYRGLM